MLTKSEITALATELTTSLAKAGKLEPGEAMTFFRNAVEELITLGPHDQPHANSNDKVAPRPVPAVPVEESVTSDFLICLEDGVKKTMLKRYLARVHGMTPDEYRQKWGLPPNYPMVAPRYSAQKSAYARAVGLGTYERDRQAY
ncbi:MucR family transcriptional regulator [Caenispirillum salinarum]|uniref:MucR family transcriptional regulator n=1 Tax=Caenispirillum salinarum TaxID=859058 RepID=UPI00068F5015|nr:MucR family transcriptional regulator [Caenispirillum salinarum]